MDADIFYTYTMDAQEALREIEESLLTLESDSNNPTEVDRLYRGLHTLKGNSALLQLVRIEALAHAAEDVVGLMREGKAGFDGPAFTLLFEVVDCLRHVTEQASRERRDAEEHQVDDLMASLKAWLQAHGGDCDGPNQGGSESLEVVLWSNAPAKLSVPPPQKLELAPPSTNLVIESQGAGAKGRGGMERLTLMPAPMPQNQPRPSLKPPTPNALVIPSKAGKGKSKAPKVAAEPKQYLRIDAQKVSAIMDLAGELTLACGSVMHHSDLEGLPLEGFRGAASKLEGLIRELQNEASAMRLVPIAEVFRPMRRVVRDAAQKTGKQVNLSLVGEETEIDKVMVERLQDPLVHSIRNAIDHGLESPQQRLEAGKPAAGTIILEASHQGGEVSVKVRDDGRGLDLDAILRRAIQRGLVRSDRELTESEITELLFLPGFSTRTMVTNMSGRGVGMDIIRTEIEKLRGRVTLHSALGRGCCLQFTVPLTLAFLEAMIVRERERLFALPIERVYDVLQVQPDQVTHSSANQETRLRVREKLVPVMWLHEFFGEPAREPRSGPDLAGQLVVVVQGSSGVAALPVDELLGTQPVILKPLHWALSNVRAAAGCGMLPTGDVALALDCERLVAS